MFVGSMMCLATKAKITANSANPNRIRNAHCESDNWNEVSFAVVFTATDSLVTVGSGLLEPDVVNRVDGLYGPVRPSELSLHMRMAQTRI